MDVPEDAMREAAAVAWLEEVVGDGSGIAAAAQTQVWVEAGGYLRQDPDEQTHLRSDVVPDGEEEGVELLHGQRCHAKDLYEKELSIAGRTSMAG